MALYHLIGIVSGGGMVTESPHDAAVREVLDRYIAACHAGDAEALRRQFHPDALIGGFLDDVPEVGTPEPFFEETAGNPAPQSSGEPYRGEVTAVEAVGRVGGCRCGQGVRPARA